MRVLVTGGAGFIGSHTAALLAERGHDVWIWDNLCRGHAAAALPGRLIEGDLSEAERLQSLLREQRIEAVVHFAALTYVGESVKHPELYYRNNVCGTHHLLAAMQASGVRKIVFSSTAAVYGQPKQIPIPEDAPLQPVNPYGRSKLVVEWMLADAMAAHGLGYIALRYFNAAGACRKGQLGEDHHPETHLIPLVLQTALGQRPAIDVFGDDYPTPDGTCIRDYVHVEDLAEAHLLALQRLTPGEGLAINIGTGRGFSVREVIETAREVTGREIPVRHALRRDGDPAVLIASNQRAASELGWHARHPELRTMIESAWQWFRQRPQGYRTNLSAQPSGQGAPSREIP